MSVTDEYGNKWRPTGGLNQYDEYQHQVALLDAEPQENTTMNKLPALTFGMVVDAIAIVHGPNWEEEMTDVGVEQAREAANIWYDAFANVLLQDKLDDGEFYKVRRKGYGTNVEIAKFKDGQFYFAGQEAPVRPFDLDGIGCKLATATLEGKPV